ncbi:MAG: hypothetical protein M1812_007156 [Candelaria pacifica]|nr:MAG: hypothetical protein M1812_007156 [Candelaria pacifica]
MADFAPRPSPQAPEAGLQSPSGSSLPYSPVDISHHELFGSSPSQSMTMRGNSRTAPLRPRPAPTGRPGIKRAVVAVQGSRLHYTDMVYSCHHVYRLTMEVPVLPDNFQTRAVISGWILEGLDDAHPYIIHSSNACEVCNNYDLRSAELARREVREGRMRLGTLSVLAMTAGLVIVRLMRSVKNDMVSRMGDIGIVLLLAVGAIMVATQLKRHQRRDIAQGMVDLAILVLVAIVVALLVARILSPLLSSLLAPLPFDEH